MDEYSLNGPLVNANTINTSQGLISILQQSSRFLLKSTSFLGFLSSVFIHSCVVSYSFSPRKLCIQRGIIQVFDLQRSLFLPTAPHSRFTPPRTSKYWHLSERAISDAKIQVLVIVHTSIAQGYVQSIPNFLINQNIILTTSSP